MPSTASTRRNEELLKHLIIRKKNFVLEDYPQEETGMICRTAEEAEEFCEFLHNAGRNWCSGESYLRSTNFNNFVNKPIVYFFNEGMYAESVEDGYSYTESAGAPMLSFRDFVFPTYDIELNPEFEAFLDEIESNIVD